MPSCWFSAPLYGFLSQFAPKIRRSYDIFLTIFEGFFLFHKLCVIIKCNTAKGDGIVRNRKLRVLYGGLFLLFSLLVLLIALFVRDSFIRPYGGDVLIVVVLCCFFKLFFPKRSVWIPFLVFLFACGVELLQGLDYVTLLGLQNISFFRIWMGMTFSFEDIFCYAMGCGLFSWSEWFVYHLFCLKKAGKNE